MLRRRWWLVVAALGTLISFVISGLPAGAAGVTVPTVATTPPPTQVPIPPVSTSPVTVPGPAPAPVPPVTVPPVTTPSVSTPPVKTPAPVPPAASTPSVQTPSGTGPLPSSAGTPSSSGSSGTSGNSATSAPGSGSATASPTPGSGAAARSVGADRSSGSGGRGHAARASGRDRAGRSSRARTRDRELRQAVVRLQGCLARVPRAERRVLVLRAGIGTARTRSRAEVARITGLQRARVARLERRGMRDLRALGRAGACAVSSGDVATGFAGIPVSGSTQSGGPTGHGVVLAERHSDPRRTLVQREAEGTPTPAAKPPIARPDISSTNRFDLALVFIPLAVVAFVLVMIREARRTT
jgi:hypothetical protein